MRGIWSSSRPAVAAGVAAGSIALVGFGFDSLIEALAGFVIVWLFTGSRLVSETAERRAQQFIAASYFVLAAYVAVESVRTLVEGHHPETSWVGIALAAVTAPTMPLLARAKRRVGHALGSSATVGEAEQLGPLPPRQPRLESADRQREHAPAARGSRARGDSRGAARHRSVGGYRRSAVAVRLQH
jgi:hypothetical protein